MAKYKAKDIANWFLWYNEYIREIANEDTDNISNLRLQKLLYYAQGCYLGLKEKPLFDEKILAWHNGPVVEELYNYYKEYNSQGIDKYDNVEIDKETEGILIEVYSTFGIFSAWGLRTIAIGDAPYKETKKGQEIDIEKIKNYFKNTYIKDLT